MIWQPIKSAPTGVDVLVIVPDTFEQFVACDMRGDWVYAYHDNGTDENFLVCYPSHWMPLPEPPL